MLLTFAMGAVCRKLLAALVAGEGASSILPKFDDANSIDITPREMGNIFCPCNRVRILSSKCESAGLCMSVTVALAAAEPSAAAGA